MVYVFAIICAFGAACSVIPWLSTVVLVLVGAGLVATAGLFIVRYLDAGRLTDEIYDAVESGEKVYDDMESLFADIDSDSNGKRR